MLLAHLLLKQFCNCKCACTMYLYVASVLMYLNVIHDFMEGGTFECFNMWDSKLNIRMFSLLGGGQGKHAPISRNVHGRFFPFKCWWAPMQNTTLIQYVMCQSYSYLLGWVSHVMWSIQMHQNVYFKQSRSVLCPSMSTFIYSSLILLSIDIMSIIHGLVCWSLTSLCHSNGHIETMPAR